MRRKSIVGKENAKILIVCLASALILLSLPLAAQEEATSGEGAEAEETEEPEAEPEQEAATQAEEAPAAEETPAAETGEEVIDQTATEEPEEQTEKETMDVIGSRIGRNNMDEYARIEVLNSEEIKMSGVSNVEQYLKSLPSVSMGGITATNPTGGGYAIIDLRNLGPARTLTLVNGRRVVGAGGASVDLSVIPVSMIERVEVLFEGASAQYGSDAIAGVVNIVLKENFEGFEVTANAGTSSRWDGQELGASMTTGISGDSGNLALNFSWYHRHPAFQRDRSWAMPPCEEVFYNADGDINSTCGSPTVPGGTVKYIPLQPRYRIDYPKGIVFIGPDGDYYAVQQIYDLWLEQNRKDPEQYPYYTYYNWGEQQAAVPQADNFQLVTNGHYNLNSYVTAYMEGMFSYRLYGGRYAGEPVRADNNALYTNGLNIPMNYPYFPDAFRTDVIEEYRISYPRDGSMPMMRLDKRANDLGARVFIDRSSTFRAVTGLKGKIAPGYDWDIFFNYGRFTEIFTTTNVPDMQRWTIAVDPEQCYATPNCIYPNLIGEGTMQKEARDFMGFDETGTYHWDMINTGAFFKMEPFSLPGGKFGAVLGGDLRWERGLNSPDSKVQDGLAPTASSESKGEYSAQEVFGELKAPFLSGKPGAYILEIDLASRVSNFSSFGTEFTYRAGLIYGPIKDIRFRGVASTSYRAPSIDNLYGGTSAGYPTVNDSCIGWERLKKDTPEHILTRDQCEKQGVPKGLKQDIAQIRTVSGSNSELTAETARIFNLGTIITPTFMPPNLPLTLTFDWYNIWIFDGITSLDPAQIMRNCYEIKGLQTDYCGYIHRSETGYVSYIESSLMNAMEVKTSGFDFSFSLGFPIFQEINGNIGFQGNIVRELYEVNPDTGLKIDSLGLVYQRDGANPKFRFVSALSFGDSRWQIANRVRYMYKMNIDTMATTDPYHDVPAVAYWDASGSLTLGDFEIRVGVDNIIDKIPPIIPGTGYNANPQVYDFMGRYFWTRLSYTFQD